MAGRKFSTSEYFNQRCAQMTPLFAFEGSDPFQAKEWRIKAAAKVRDLLGEMPDRVPLAAEILERVDLGDYVREKFIFDSDPLSSVPGYILIPKGGESRMRALMCLHGHGPGCCAVAHVVEPRPDYTEDQVRECIIQHNYDYAVQFVRR
ncbi:MAG: alpha/beta hydrolase family protein, partial [Armatimonadetes bacterium]|nr:alpha/beta hydrolase family protein [Armatimonadota bacterium]